MKNIKLRPHHALCIGFFEGRGYSEAFIQNMKSVIETLKNENPTVTFVSSGDIICEFCPNYFERSCESSDKSEYYDAKCLEMLGRRYGDMLEWNVLVDIVRKKILFSGKLSDICSDCEWYGICSGKLPH